MMFQVLVKEHAPMLVSYLASFTRSREDAEDVAQETFVKAYVNFEQFSEEKGHFAAWLRGIGRNLAVDHYRRTKRMVALDPQVLEGVDEMFSAADQAGEGDAWDDRVSFLRRCVEMLPERLRTACDLHYYKGLGAKSVAEKIGATLSAVLKRLERARRSLRDCMDRKLSIS